MNHYEKESQNNQHYSRLDQAANRGQHQRPAYEGMDIRRSVGVRVENVSGIRENAGGLELAKKKQRPIEKPLVIPPIRKPEAEKKHIKKDGKK